jgi:nicotinamidase/pyrazinamidase
MARQPGAAEALLVVDVQSDFCPGGSLPVHEGDAVVPVLNEWIDRFAAEGRPVVLSRDWHPAVTSHFQTQGGPWPPHCVQGTPGAAFHPRLRFPPGVRVVSKGMAKDEDGYSAFVARDDRGRPLVDLLRELGIEKLVIGGLATDYCVKWSVLEAREAGLDVDVIESAIRAVEVAPGDGERAIEAMRKAGARLI